jgi:hypothetical protein
MFLEEQGRRPGRRHDGAASVVAARPLSKSCTGEEATSCSWPSSQAQHGGDVGVAAAVQLTRRGGEHRKHRRARTGALAKLTGVDQPHGQDLLGQSSTAMVAIRGGGDETPQSGGRARQGKADVLEGSGGSRRSSPKSSKGLIGDSRITRRGLGLGFDREGSEWGGMAGWTGPVRSSPLGVTDRWAQAISPNFDFLFNLVLFKNL